MLGTQNLQLSTVSNKHMAWIHQWQEYWTAYKKTRELEGILIWLFNRFNCLIDCHHYDINPLMVEMSSTSSFNFRVLSRRVGLQALLITYKPTQLPTQSKSRIEKRLKNDGAMSNSVKTQVHLNDYPMFKLNDRFDLDSIDQKLNDGLDWAWFDRSIFDRRGLFFFCGNRFIFSHESKSCETYLEREQYTNFHRLVYKYRVALRVAPN